MGSLLSSLARRGAVERDRPISMAEWAQMFTFDGATYPVGVPSQTLGHTTEDIAPHFTGVVRGAYQANGVVFACMLARQLLFSEARFQFRNRRNGRPGDLFGTQALSVIERPSAGATTGDLLSRAIQDADLAGNWYGARIGGGIRRLRPDWVTIILGSHLYPDEPGLAPDAEVVGYLFHPGGRAAGKTPSTFLPGEVAHFAPIPDPEAQFRGMSWLTPVLREVMADMSMTTHQQSFFDRGATPNMVVTLDREIRREAFDAWIQAFEANHAGSVNAYRTLYLGAGAQAEVVGVDMKALDFKSVRGHGETRIAAAAGVPPVIVGLSEGLQAATYSNYGQARRRFADGTMRPLWRSMAGALAPLVAVPSGSELWYDARDIPFLQEDEQDKANIQQTQANAIRSLVEAGYDPDSVIAAITADDMSRLTHSGLYSVQLQEPGTEPGTGKTTPPAEPEAPTNGAGRALAVLGRSIERRTP